MFEILSKAYQVVWQGRLRESLYNLRSRFLTWLLFQLHKFLCREWDRAQSPVRESYIERMESFLRDVNALPSPKVLEVGSRKVTDTLRHRFGPHVSYTGLDIHPGANVDVVGDVHALTSYFPKKQFDVVLAHSVLEHIAIPWSAILEMNSVLKTGGLLYLFTHPNWPAHELPWDFWRFSSESFKVLLNSMTGFELLVSEESLPATILPRAENQRLVCRNPVSLGVTAIAKKIGEPNLSLNWNLNLEDCLRGTRYPVRL